MTSTQSINRIKNKHMYFAKVEQKVFLQSVGRNCESYLSDSTSDNSSDSEIETDDDDDINNIDQEESHPEIETVDKRIHPLSTMDLNSQSELGTPVNCSEVQPFDSSAQDKESWNETPVTQTQRKYDALDKTPSQLDVNSVVVLDILREVEWNWFSFVVLLAPKYERNGYTQEVFDQFLLDFASQLPNLGLNDKELNLTEQSRMAYLSDDAEGSKNRRDYR